MGATGLGSKGLQGYMCEGGLFAVKFGALIEGVKWLLLTGYSG